MDQIEQPQEEIDISGYLEVIGTGIAETGFAIVSVEGIAHYTAGLSELGLADIIVYWPHDDITMVEELLGTVVNSLMEKGVNGMMFPMWNDPNGDEDTYVRMRLVEVEPVVDLNQAGPTMVDPLFARLRAQQMGAELRLMQFTWADPNGRLPGEDEYSYTEVQPEHARLEPAEMYPSYDNFNSIRMSTQEDWDNEGE